MIGAKRELIPMQYTTRASDIVNNHGEIFLF